MKRAGLLWGAALVSVLMVRAATIQQNWIEDVSYSDVEQGENLGIDRALVDLLFSREPVTPISSSQLLNDGTKELVFFFPMVDAVNNLNSRVLRKVNAQRDKVCDVAVEPVEGPENGLKVTFRYSPDELSVVCHVGLEGDRRRVRFRIHNKKLIKRLEQFNALRMARLFGRAEGRIAVVHASVAMM